MKMLSMKITNKCARNLDKEFMLNRRFVSFVIFVDKAFDVTKFCLPACGRMRPLYI